MSDGDLNLGKYQFEVLKKLSIHGGVVDATEMPDGVDAWVLHRLAERGLIKLSAALTERGAQALYRKEEIEADKAERRERILIRARMAKNKAEEFRIEREIIKSNPIAPFPITRQAPAKLIEMNLGRKTAPKKALPSEFKVDRRKLMGCR